MTLVVTRDVADRYRGFLASVMPEAAPGLYVAAELSKGVRERLWSVMCDWWGSAPGGSIVLVWRDDAAPGRLGLRALGLPPRDLADLDGALLVRRPRTRDPPAVTAPPLRTRSSPIASGSDEPPF